MLRENRDGDKAPIPGELVKSAVSEHGDWLEQLWLSEGGDWWKGEWEVYLWGDDVEKVPRGGIFLSEHIAVFRLKKHVEDFDNERAAAKWAC